jgi:hypothetical protein
MAITNTIVFNIKKQNEEDDENTERIKKKKA